MHTCILLLKVTRRGTWINEFAC